MASPCHGASPWPRRVPGPVGCAIRRRPSTRASCRATWPSSWTAIAAGHASGACPRPRATPPVSRPSGRSCERAQQRGVEVLSIYAFSRENWARGERRGRDALRAARRGHPRLHPGAGAAGRRGPAAGPARGAADGRRRTSIEEALARTAGGSAHDPQRGVQLLRAVRDRGCRATVHPATALAADDVDEAAIERASTPPSCRRSTCSSGPAATSASATSCCGRPPTRSSTSATVLAGLRTRPSSTRRWRNTPAARAASAARELPDMQQRLISAAVLVPVVLVVFLLGQPWLTLGIAIAGRGSRASRRRACCAPQGSPWSRALVAMAPAVAVSGWRCLTPPRARRWPSVAAVHRHRARMAGLPPAGCPRGLPGLGRAPPSAPSTCRCLAFAAGDPRAWHRQLPPEAPLDGVARRRPGVAAGAAC